MITLLKIETDEPLAAGLLQVLESERLQLEFAGVEPGRMVLLKVRRLPAEDKPEDRSAQATIHHKHDNIAATVQQPREDLLTDEPQGPMPAYGRALGDLMEDPATKDVAKLLIAPLLERGLRIEGNPAKALSKVAHEFKDLSASKLSFAAQYLLKGKHELFPDFEEIYAAIGRYKPSPKPSAADPAAHVNGAQA